MVEKTLDAFASWLDVLDPILSTLDVDSTLSAL
jgi:hypothetical protein